MSATSTTNFIVVFNNMADEVVEHANKVLAFWFGGDLNVNYKTKWFPSGNDDAEQRADSLVQTLFGELFEDCSSKSFEELSVWRFDTTWHVALIILLDQFSRHIFRALNKPKLHPERARVDSLALALTENLIARANWDEKLTHPEFVFALMPLRHNATVDRLQIVMSSIDAREKLGKEAIELLHKFRKQTLRRLQGLQDRAKVSVGCKLNSSSECEFLPFAHESMVMKQAEESDEILERQPFASDESDVMSNCLVDATATFLARHMRARADTLTLTCGKFGL